MKCLFTLAASLFLGAAATAQVPTQEAHPNVVLIIIDTLRADRIAAQRNGVPVMPRLHALAEQAWDFENACAAASWTKPSVTSILTGLYPKTHGIINGSHLSLDDGNDAAVIEGVPIEKELAAEFFKKGGYTTFCVQTNQLLRAKDGYARGFDTYIEAKDTGAQAVGLQVYRNTGKLVPPFFLYVHYMDPHAPYNPPPEHRAAFGALPPLSDDEQKTVAARDAIDAYYLNRLFRDCGKSAGHKTAAYSDAAREYVRALYDGDCHYLDDQAGLLVQRFRDRWPNTVFVVVADHGEELWDHGRLGHGATLNQELIHVPLVMVVPGAEARRIETPVESVDILPTLAALCGLKPDDAWQGRDISAPTLTERPVYSETNGTFVEERLNFAAIIEDGKKLIRENGGAAKLFDLRKDPDEATDLGVKEPKLKDALSAKLRAHDEACRAHPLAHIKPATSGMDPEQIEKLRALGYVGPSKK